MKKMNDPLKYELEKVARLSDDECEAELRKLSDSYDLSPGLLGKITWPFSKRGRIAHIENRLCGIERKAAKYLMHRINPKNIHGLSDEALRNTKLTFWSYAGRLMGYGEAYGKLTGETEKISSPNYYQACTLVMAGMQIIERKINRRNYGGNRKVSPEEN
jgi:hypothetical protein